MNPHEAGRAGASRASDISDGVDAPAQAVSGHTDVPNTLAEDQR
ncbi:hypothetical protein ACIOJD_22770 [Streptomyces sp. NPDC088116]